MSFRKSAQRKPSKAQTNCLEKLLNDCGFSTRTDRNAFLTRKTDRDIHYLDDLTFTEARLLTDELIQRKNGTYQECQHEPCIVHRTGGKDARYWNWCGRCGQEITRLTEEDPWETMA